MADYLTRLRRLEERVVKLHPPIDVEASATFVRQFGVFIPKPDEDQTPLVRFASWLSRHPPRYGGNLRRSDTLRAELAEDDVSNVASLSVSRYSLVPDASTAGAASTCRVTITANGCIAYNYVC